MENDTNDAVQEVEIKKTQTPRRTFSVSKEFESILKDIDTMPNMSRFVCEAISEKMERVKNPGKDVADALANFVQIQSIISQPIQTIQSLSNTEGNVVSPSPSVPLEQVPVETQKPTTKEPPSSVKVAEPKEEKVSAPTKTEDTEIKKSVVDESISSTKDTIEKKETNESPNEFIEDMKKKTLESYFNKG